MYKIATTAARRAKRTNNLALLVSIYFIQKLLMSVQDHSEVIVSQNTVGCRAKVIKI